MKLIPGFLLLFGCASAIPAQMTRDQKLLDFQSLAGLYAKRYAPYEWKRDVIGFDLLKLSSWLDRVSASKDDLDYYEICIDYISRLNDAHDLFLLPASFRATLGFSSDIYDGKVLIDAINRTRLPASNYPFQIGDELVSIDGKSAEDLIASFSKYEIAANLRSTRRAAVGLLTVRPQIIMPHATDVSETAAVQIRRQNGDLQTFTIPWVKTGVPLVSSGPVPSPKSAPGTPSRAGSSLAGGKQFPSYLDPLLRLQNTRLPDAKTSVIGFGALAPVFALPSGFQQRLGRSVSDNFFSGVIQVGGYRIGFIRIPQYEPFTSVGAAFQQFDREIAFFQDNTDGLIVDEMRNPGGFVFYVTELLRRLIPYRFRTMGFEIRATSSWIQEFANALQEAKDQGAPQWVINLLGAYLKDLEQANRENRGRTGALPLDSDSIDIDPVTDRNGNVIAYNKPLMVLIDEFSASGADAFPAILQDNQRGILLGMRTMGAGGTNEEFNVGSYSEGAAVVTTSLMRRKEPVVTADFPVSPYVENIGVRPDVDVDYMTLDNLLNRGKSFVDAFTAAMVDYIAKNQ